MSTTTTVTTPDTATDPISPSELDPRPTTSEHATESRTLSQFEIVEPTENDQDDPTYPTGFKFWGIVSSLSLVLILAGLDGNILATAVPAITDHFHTVADVGWYSSAYRLCVSAFQFAFGKMYQQFSIKKIYMISLALFLLGSAIVATAATSAVFIAGRAVAGVGGAGLTAGAFIIVTQIMPLRKRPVFMSLLGMAEGVAIIVAPIIGGVLTESLSWRWCFYINLPIGGLALITIALLFSNPRPGEGTNLSLKQKLDQLDIIGNFFFIPSMTSLFLILSWAGIKFSWTDPKIIGLFVVFGVLLVAFIYTQYLRGDKATLPTRIFKQRSVMASFVFITCMSGAMSVVAYYLPTYFQTVLGYSPAASGYLLLPFMIAFLVAVLVHGALTSMLGYYTPFMIVGSILAPIAAGLLTTLKVQTEIVRTLIYGGLAGFGAGLGIQAPQSAVQCALPAADVPIGLSFVTFGQQFGSALFVALAQTILSNQLATNLQRFDPDLTAKAIGNMGIMELKHSLTQHGRFARSALRSRRELDADLVSCGRASRRNDFWKPSHGMAICKGEEKLASSGRKMLSKRQQKEMY